MPPWHNLVLRSPGKAVSFGMSRFKSGRRRTMLERVQKILAAAGIASRRKCEELIIAGKVTVNGKVIKLGDKADPEKDVIEVSGKRILPESKVYIVLNKPAGYVTTVSEPFGMRTVMQLVKGKVKQRVFPVGRLDKDTEGLLLLTNDGELANKLTHPSFEIQKEYQVVLDKPLEKHHAATLAKGLEIDGRKVRVQLPSVRGIDVRLRIHEGRKHIVKRLFAKLGYIVKRLKRTAIGPLQLRTLERGKWRKLGPAEVKTLEEAAAH